MFCAAKFRREPMDSPGFLFQNNKRLFWDNTCVDTFNQTYLAKWALEAGAAMDQAKKRKRAMYQKITQIYLFEPNAVESTGVYGPSTRKLLNIIATNYDR